MPTQNPSAGTTTGQPSDQSWSQRFPASLVVLLVLLDSLMQSFGSRLPETAQYFGAALIPILILVAGIWWVAHLLAEWRRGARKEVVVQSICVVAVIIIAVLLTPYLKAHAQSTPANPAVPQGQAAPSPPPVSGMQPPPTPQQRPQGAAPLIGNGANVSQSSTGDCSPNIIGSNNNTKCETALKPKILTQIDKNDLLNKLPRDMAVRVGYFSGVPDGESFAQQILSFLQSVGYEAYGFDIRMGGGLPTGRFEVRPSANGSFMVVTAGSGQ